MVVAHSYRDALAMGLWGLVENSEHIAHYCVGCDETSQRHFYDVSVAVDGEEELVGLCDECVVENS